MDDSEKLAALEAEVIRLQTALMAIIERDKDSDEYPVTNAQIEMHKLACEALGLPIER